MNKKYTAIGFTVLVLILVFVFVQSNQVKAEVNLPIPFTSQAPTQNWDRNEDCEETSIAMAMAFLNGQTNEHMSVTDAQNAIAQLKTWEQANIGYNADTGAVATTKMAEGAFKLKVKQINNYTEQDLKKALSKGHPVLLSINARQLGNPKYQDTGPFYHMFVVRGYNAEGFIVNDPGTEGGAGNVYTFETLKNAAADWNQAKQAMEPTSKIALILSK